MYNFTIVLLVKTGRLIEQEYNRMPTPLTLNMDVDLKDQLDDPLRYSTLSNIVHSPALKADGTPWRGNREISDVIYQIIIEMCSSPGQIVGDLTSSTRASIWAYKASARHFFGLEAEKEIFDV